MKTDPVLQNDWHVVAASGDIKDDKIAGVQLLDENLVVWRCAGSAQVWLDKCPHRGSRLSLGQVRNNDTLVCPYHGWHFNGGGTCTRMPAHPNHPISDRARATTFKVREKYGLVWVCPGEPVREVPDFHGLDESYHLVITGPYDVETSGPRVVENFLDLAHFPFVHKGWLGDEPYTEMNEYVVEESDESIVVSNARAWQPRANAVIGAPVKVAYTYRVLRPLTVMLTKEPGSDDGKPTDLILLSIQPKSETSIRAWFVMALNYGHDQPDSYFREFQDAIFYQDKTVLESQQPRRLPLDPRAELHQPADRSSNAYRRWLQALGLRYGVEAAG